MERINTQAIKAIRNTLKTHAQQQKADRNELRRLQSVVANKQATTPDLWSLADMSPTRKHPLYLAQQDAISLQHRINQRREETRGYIHFYRKLRELPVLDKMGLEYESHKAANTFEYRYGYSGFKAADHAINEKLLRVSHHVSRPAEEHSTAACD